MAKLENKTIASASCIAQDRQLLEILSNRHFPDCLTYTKNGVTVNEYILQKRELTFFMTGKDFEDNVAQVVRSRKSYLYELQSNIILTLVGEASKLDGFPRYIVPRAAKPFDEPNKNGDGLLLNFYCQAAKHFCPRTFYFEFLFEKAMVNDDDFVEVRIVLSNNNDIHLNGFPYGTCTGGLRRVLAANKPRKMVIESLKNLDDAEYWYMNRTVCSFIQTI